MPPLALSCVGALCSTGLPNIVTQAGAKYSLHPQYNGPDSGYGRVQLAVVKTTTPSIGFDALFLEHPMTGMGQYATRLWQELLQRDDVQARLLHPADAPGAVLKLAAGRGVSVAPPAGRNLPGKVRKVWWEQQGVVSASRTADVDLVHVPYFAAPLRKPKRLVVTIHDAIPLALEAYAGGLLNRGYLKVLSRAAKRADLILTDSRHAAGDISTYLDIPSDRIVPILLAAGEEFTPSGPEDDARIAEMRTRLGLERPFILNVGGFDRRKNLPALVEGFAGAIGQLEERYDLVIVGSPHSDSELFIDVRPLVRQHGLGDHVKLPGFVSEQDKLDLYRAASAFVFPSVYEGFGLNPLEAMACGTPTISSNRSSLPEVVGDGGILIDPSREEITNALVQVLNDPALQADLRQRGIAQAATLSWQQTASKTIEAYKRVLE